MRMVHPYLFPVLLVVTARPWSADAQNLAFLGLHEELRPATQAKLKGLERKLRMSSPS